MAATPSSPHRPVRHDGTRDFNVRIPDNNEAILLRLPFEVTLGPPSIISTNAPTGANDANYHLCFVSGRVVHREPNSIQLDVWVCLGFSSAVPNSHAFVQSLSAEWQECLLPIPYAPQTPPLVPLPTPTGFGEPLQIGGFLARKPCYLNIRPVPIKITAGVPFKRFQPPGFLSDDEITRLEIYALHVPRLVLPIRYDQGGNSPPPDGNTSNAPLDTAGPASQYPDLPSGPAPTAPTAEGDPNTTAIQHAVHTDELLEKWYPELTDMVCAEDATTCSGCESDQDGLSFLQYARLFAYTSADLRAVVEQHDTKESAARNEKVDSWLRSTLDVSVR